jgi:DNA helicase II / ATP-dependent DNA helicase PcrA
MSKRSKGRIVLLLLWWAQMMSEPAIAEEIGGRFDHIMVDEYQDTIRLQATILLALKPNGYGLTVVGNDARSIYSFRAATVRNILNFPEHFSPRPRSSPWTETTAPLSRCSRPPTA